MEIGPEWSPFYASMGGNGRSFHACASCRHLKRSGATGVQLTWRELVWQPCACSACTGHLPRILDEFIDKNKFYAALREGKIGVAGWLHPRELFMNDLGNGRRRRCEEQDADRDTKRAKTDS